MAIYNHLPVYKTSYDLLLKIFDATKTFTKEYKYTLGDKIKSETIDLMTSVYRVNSSFENRLVHIKKSRESIEVVRLYLRLSNDLKIINLTRFVDINVLIESISKQLLAWENSLGKTAGQNL